jgi:hypothetical protein
MTYKPAIFSDWFVCHLHWKNLFHVGCFCTTPRKGGIKNSPPDIYIFQRGISDRLTRDNGEIRVKTGHNLGIFTNEH